MISDSLFQAIDIYCERTTAEYWDEPLNIVSNIAFLIIVGYLHQLYKEQNRKDRESLILIGLVGLLGIGSFAFHIYGNVLTLFMDIIPIGLFVFYYLWVALKRFLHWSPNRRLMALAALGVTQYALGLLPPPNFNGSLPYFPCLIAIIFIGCRLQKDRHLPEAETFFKAGVWFTISLSFRILDMAICHLFPLGTHFIWHICNSIVLLLLVGAVIKKPAVTLK